MDPTDGQKKHGAPDDTVANFMLAHVRDPLPVTTEGLHLLIGAGHQLLRTLEVVLHDMYLRRGNKRLIFALDFSELYTYLWPERTHTAQVSRLLLQSDRLEFTVPPGATVELIRTLKRFASVHEPQRRDFAQFFNQPMVTAFLRAFHSSQGSAALGVLTADLPAVNAAIERLIPVHTLVSRLRHINQMRTLIPFDRLIDEEDDELRPDGDVLSDGLMSLNLRRPGELALNNFVDAHNYALLTTLSTAHVHRKRSIYFLVTSSPTPYSVFRKMPWTKFPDTLPNTRLPELSLVRHPIQALYLSMLQNNDRHLRALQGMITGLGTILERWRKLEPYDVFLHTGQNATAKVAFPNDRAYLNAYSRFSGLYQELFAPVGDAIRSDLIAEENVRRLRDVSVERAGSRVVGDFEDTTQITTSRLVFELLDSLNAVTEETIERLGGGLKKLPVHIVQDVDSDGHVVQQPPIRLKRGWNREFGCMEVAALHKGINEPLFAGDIYGHFFTLWWHTRVTFTEFLEQGRRLIASGRQVALQYGPAGDQRKAFDGILFYPSDREPIVIPLSRHADLDPEELLDVARQSSAQSLQMVRIATDIGDLCYDFGAFRGVPQRAGIMSHLPLADPIALLVHSTSNRRVGYPYVRRLVDETLTVFSRGVS